MGIKLKANVKFGPLYSHIRSSTRQAERMLTAQAANDMNNYVPMRDGPLRGSMSVGTNQITWQTVYARAQFYGTNGYVVFRKYTTAGTGKRWDLKAAGIHGTEWKELVERCY